jgi:hypothetical protein
MNSRHKTHTFTKATVICAWCKASRVFDLKSLQNRIGATSCPKCGGPEIIARGAPYKRRAANLDHDPIEPESEHRRKVSVLPERVTKKRV